MPKIVGTREGHHTEFYKSLLRSEQPALNALALGMYDATKRLPSRRFQASHECRHCGAPRRAAPTCDYCDRTYT